MRESANSIRTDVCINPVFSKDRESPNPHKVEAIRVAEPTHNAKDLSSIMQDL